MKQPESDYEKYDSDQEPARYLPECSGKADATQIEIMSDIAGKSDDDAVKQENAPIGERFFGKVPIRNITEYSPIIN